MNVHIKCETFAMCVKITVSGQTNVCQVAATNQWDSHTVTGPQVHSHHTRHTVTTTMYDLYDM